MRSGDRLQSVVAAMHITPCACCFVLQAWSKRAEIGTAFDAFKRALAEGRR
jgi:hypothetical protein